MNDILTEISQQSLVQWIALISGMIYVVLAARGLLACWIFGIISSACIAWEDFVNFHLYADGVLQLIYILLGAVGLISWLRSRPKSDDLEVSTLALGHHLLALLGALLISYPIWVLLEMYTDAAFGYLDTLTTVLSLFATWLLIRQKLSTWLYWIVIDAVYVVLYVRTGGLLIGFLFVLYLIFSVYGYYFWRNSYRNSKIY